MQRRRGHGVPGPRRGDADRRHALNPDQYLAAVAMRDAGAGLLLRASTVTQAQVRTAVECVMREERFTQAAQRMAESFAGFDPHARFRAVVDEVTAHNATANGTIRSTT